MSSTYSGSNMKLINDFVINTAAFFERNRSILTYNENFNQELSLNRTFLAIATPSLEGKTQTAFSLQDTNPIYFVMSAPKDSKEIIQPTHLPILFPSQCLSP